MIDYSEINKTIIEKEINKFIKNKDYTCIPEIWTKCLQMNPCTKPSRNTSSFIADVLRKNGWESNKRKRFKEYGQQRIWEPCLVYDYDPDNIDNIPLEPQDTTEILKLSVELLDKAVKLLSKCC